VEVTKIVLVSVSHTYLIPTYSYLIPYTYLILIFAIKTGACSSGAPYGMPLGGFAIKTGACPSGAPYGMPLGGSGW
jgi:hypothetical protein